MPSWFPGTFYANFARGYQKMVRALHDLPFTRVEEDLVRISTAFLLGTSSALMYRTFRPPARLNPPLSPSTLKVALVKVTITVINWMISKVVPLPCTLAAQKQYAIVLPHE
jgi:hypothetical protein